MKTIHALLAVTTTITVASFTTNDASAQPLEQLPPQPSSTPTTPAPTGATPETTTPPPAPPPANYDTPPPAAPPQTSEDELARTFRVSFRGQGGYQYEQLNGIPITGGRGRFAFGAQNDTQAHYAVLSFLYGRTEGELRAWDLRVGWIGDFYRRGILRLGVDVEMGYSIVRRITIDKGMWALGLGGGVHAGVDVFQFGARDDHAVFIEGRFDGHVMFGPAFTWGPSLFVGIRY